MIIKREYVSFRRLVASGDEAGKTFMEKFHQSYDEHDWDRIWNILADQCLYQREMSWAFVKLGDIIEAFEMLDETCPFDNGLSYDDINDVDIVMREDDYITLHLVSKFDGYSTIVKVVTIKE